MRHYLLGQAKTVLPPLSKKSIDLIGFRGKISSLYRNCATLALLQLIWTLACILQVRTICKVRKCQWSLIIQILNEIRSYLDNRFVKSQFGVSLPSKITCDLCPVCGQKIGCHRARVSNRDTLIVFWRTRVTEKCYQNHIFEFIESIDSCEFRV